MQLADVKLEHKYTLPRGRVYLDGIQALARLLVMQRMRDAAAGLNTAGFVSGFRGSRAAAMRFCTATRPAQRHTAECSSSAATTTWRARQYPRMRRLRRLQHPVELRVGDAGGNRVRTQARHRPVVVKQGFLLPEWLLSELRQRQRRAAAQG